MDKIEDIKKKIEVINQFHRRINVMEVCGTHTMAIGKFGIRSILNENINLISGPGCPVCVTPDMYIDYVYKLCLNKDIIITTYGDMIRVPGSSPSFTLENAKANGANIRMVYSSMDALQIAEVNKDKIVVFLGIGFETTTPATAIAVLEAEGREINNFYILSMHKIVEPVMRVLLDDKSLKIDGFLCPGHVGVIIGENGFKFIEEYECASVIAGFEMDEIVDGIYSLTESLKKREYSIKNTYKKLVRPEGNITALSIIDQVFEVRDDYWRGIGLVKNSGYKLNSKYSKFDIESIYPVTVEENSHKSGCQCGEVLKGKIRPNECKLFGKVCSPDYPIGPCMVSGEGSCAAYYRYSGE